MKDLIRDDGKIRNCDSNIVKLGYWKALIFIRPFSILGAMGGALEGLKDGFLAIIALLILPIYPFIDTYFRYKQAKRNVKAFENKP